MSVHSSVVVGNWNKINHKHLCIFQIKSTTASKRGKKRPNTESKEFLEMCKVAFGNQSKEISEFDAVGVSITKKLQRMDPIQAIYAEDLINSILKKGLLNKLSEQTNICEGNYCKQPLIPVPSTSASSGAFSHNSDESNAQWQQSFSNAASFYGSANSFINNSQ